MPPVDTSVAPCDFSCQVTPIHSCAELERVAPEWDALAQDVPFRSWDWADTWWRHYGNPTMRLFALTVRDDDDRLIGIAPWYRSRTGGWGRVVQFLGSGEVCSEYPSLLCRPEHAQAVAASVVAWLTHEAADEWDVLELSAVDSADAAIGHLRDAFVQRGHAICEQQNLRCWRTTLPASWDAYLARLSKSRRERTRSQLRKLAGSDRVQLHRADSIDRVRHAFDILVELHQKRRGMLDQAGCFASKRFTEFHRDMADRFLAAGCLRLSWLELDGRPIAVEYSFAGRDTIYYYQGGMEPDVADLRPGWLMFALTLRQAIAEGYRYFDFLRGDEPYKASWLAEPRPLVQLRIAGRRPAARVRHAAWQTRETMKRWVQSTWRLGLGRSKSPRGAIPGGQQSP